MSLRLTLPPMAVAFCLAGCSDPTGTAFLQDTESAAPQLAIPALLDSEQRTVSHIFIADATGANIVRLTTGQTPAWSPDGKRITFSRRDGLIYIVDIASRAETTVGKGQWPSWSPDGARIVFTSNDGIGVMNADGSDVRTLIRHDFRTDTYLPWDMGVGKPSWSPDGKYIAFEHMGDGDTQPGQIYFMTADGSTVHRLFERITRYRFAESDPAWSPDGKKLVFWSYGLGIARANIDDGVATTIFASFPYVAYGAAPTWSPNGDLVAFNTFTSDPRTPRDILVASASGTSGARVLIRDAFGARWSPDGTRIAFVSNRFAKSK